MNTKTKNPKLKKVIIWIIILILSASIVTGLLIYKQNVDFKNDVIKSNSSIVRVEARVNARQVVYGAGSIIRWEEKTQTAWILTANHVISTTDFSKHTKEINVYDKDNKEITKLKEKEESSTDFTYKAKVKQDLAIVKIKLNIHNPYVFKIGKVDYENRPMDYRVSTKGYPRMKGNENEKLQVLEGIGVYTMYWKGIEVTDNFSHKSVIFDKEAFFITNCMGDGNSGGPVLDKNNEIVGIISSATDEEKSELGKYTMYKTAAVRYEYINKIINEFK